MDTGATADVQDRAGGGGRYRASSSCVRRYLEPVGLEPGVLAPLVVVGEHRRIELEFLLHPASLVARRPATPRFAVRVVSPRRLGCARSRRRTGLLR